MMNFLFAEAMAQTAGAAPQAPAWTQFVPLVFIGFIFYFLILKPQKKKLQEEQVFLNNLQKGTEVFTKSGIIGTIVGITEKVVTLEVSEGVRLKFLRSQVGGLAQKIFDKTPEK